ncbi:enoyl-CoA hydratase [uncultured Ferrovibrio sp.]|jgi:enoyl-CoA hydratase/carnithine racemase|uniref:enoyl-CoA hydratase n=1 Tax=uncultured Ferrovibrio sp. TaxID=1576913 RepID=UPI00261B7E5F|nr:enoyl-CoA hydratase [uncultured Ferrovibrio sp.]
MSEILTTPADGILTITFNRPDKKNALTSAMYASLADALEKADTESDVRVILFTGNGGAFTAGNDLQDFLNNPPAGEETPVFRFLRAISTISKPMIAAVSGVAVGVGTTMLLHCDLVYAAENAKFSLPFVNLALVPEAASSLLLPRMIGHHRASELLLLGEPFTAATAKEYGIVNAVHAEDRLLDEAMQVARKIAAKPPTAVRLTKQLLRQSKGDVAGQMAAEGVHFRAQLKSAEAREAMTAFFEKRPPKFS